MEKLDWIKDLLLEEQDKEVKGLVDVAIDIQPATSIEKESIHFLRELKNSFAEAANMYNGFRRDVSSQIKVYGVSKTVSDFMLFRNNVQLIFSLKEPGVIQVYSSQLNTDLVGMPGENKSSRSLIHKIRAKLGAFDELQWTFKGEVFNVESLVKYYFSLFIRMSANH
ncbi:MAG: hypothetical protein KDD40_01650 [Bdellovibrionales bacterium]|nr:hypothetical protein [Bdellovibrionales bacterium]